MMEEHSYDVVVVGCGNAAMCAALAARENASRVLVLERAPFGLHGGNTAFTAGALRFAYNNGAEVLELIPDLSPEMISNTDFGSYPEQSFYDDICRVTEYRTDPELADILVSRSFQTLKWLYGYGIRYLPSYGRQAFKVDGKFTFWGGLVLETVGGGQGLVDSLTKALDAKDIDLWYGARACRRAAGSPACWCAGRAGRNLSWPTLWYWRTAGSRPTRKCGPSTWVLA